MRYGSVLFLIVLIGSCARPQMTPQAPLASQASQPEMGKTAGFEAAADAPEVKGASFVSPKLCGGCHSKQYTQWLGSMHHYAQASIPNELVNQFLLQRTGGTAGPFCIRCHTPIGTEMGEPYALLNAERSPISMAGISCDVCHSISADHGQVQAFFPLRPGSKVFGPQGSGQPEDPPLSQVDFHQAEQRDVFKSSEMCQQCHEVIVPNGLRLQETYSEWKSSPWAEEGVTCQSCHMGPIPGRPSERPVGAIAQVGDMELPQRPQSDHRFIGVDYHWTDDYPLRGKEGAAPDARTRKRNLKLQEEYSEQRSKLMRNAARVEVTAPLSLSPGGEGQLTLRIENTFTGHHFPSGFPWRQAWVEATYTDADGQVFFKSGDLDANQDVRNRFSDAVNTGKAELDDHLVNLSPQITIRGFRGNDIELPFPLAEEDAPSPTVFPAVTPQWVYNGAENARIIKRGIPARQSRQFTYPIQLPKRVVGPIQYKFRLLYRNYPPYYFDYFIRQYPDKAELLTQMKAKIPVYTVDEVTGQIATLPGR
jgi:hypothetical protein